MRGARGTEASRDLSITEALTCAAAMTDRGMHHEAEGLARCALMHEPDNFEAMSRLGTALFEQRKLHEAFFLFWRARKANPKSPTALSNYAIALGELGMAADSVPYLERAIELSAKRRAPAATQAIYWNNLGNTLIRLDKHREALFALDKCVAIDPDHELGHYNRGVTLLKLGRHAEALEVLDRAVSLSSDHPDARYNRGMAKLALGDLAGGFADYEARLLTSENAKPNMGFQAEKKWTGQDIEGKTLFVVAEQGLGDTIQFLRFVPHLKAGKTMLAVQTSLTPLVEATMPHVRVIPGKAEIESSSYDYWVPLMSLPHRLGIACEEQIPVPWPVENAVGRTSAKGGVGVVWAGNWRHKNDSHRSIPLAQFTALFAAPRRFISLQQMRPGEREEFARTQAKHQNISAAEHADLRDLAAAILSLDLVVTVDTAVAHLAGSLGVPTWVLIPKFGTDWRWQIGRTDSPWYPSMRLFRQDKVGDWKPPLERVASELSQTSRLRAASSF